VTLDIEDKSSERDIVWPSIPELQRGGGAHVMGWGCPFVPIKLHIGLTLRVGSVSDDATDQSVSWWAPNADSNSGGQ
jgi:hypothetical protein